MRRFSDVCGRLGCMTLVILQLVACVSYAEPWHVYGNARFGYTLSYPSLLIAEDEADNGDGRKFHSRNGELNMLVFGQYDSTPLGPKDGLRDEINKNPRNISYKASDEESFIIVRIVGGRCKFTKRYHKNDLSVSIESDYPQSQGDYYLRIVNEIANKFHPFLGD